MAETLKPNYEYITKFDRLKELCLKDLAKETMIAVDTEGTSLDPFSNELLLIQLSTKEKAYVLDVRQLKDLSPIKDILENEKVVKLTQNGKFDYKAIKVPLNISMRNVYDTMLAEGLLMAGLGFRGFSLENIAKKYLDIQLKKEVRATFAVGGNINKDQIEYAAADVLVLFPIFEKQFADIQKKDLTKVAKLEFAVLRVVAEMELRGIHLDEKKWRTNIKEFQEKRNELAEKIQNEIRPYYNNSQVDLFGNLGEAINLNSQKQLMELLNDKLNLNVPSTGEKILQQVNHPIAKILLEYRGFEKIISAFGENVLAKINNKTGRLHPDYLQLGAATGRFSCTNPNLQQIPRDATFRSCFTSSEGCKLINADYSQAELRILADYSKDPAFLTAYKEGADLHTLTASQMYGVSMDKVTKEMRQATKTINFGLMYGRGASSLGAQIGIGPEEARKLLDKYFTAYAGVKKWLDKTANDAVKNGYAETKLGRKRWFTLPDKSSMEYTKDIARIQREAKNHPIQGTSADMTKLALVYIANRFEKEGIKGGIINTVHDEIISEVPDDQAEIVLKIQQEEMVRAGETLLKSCPIVAEGMISDHWEH